jgi:hypothetical protein
MIPPRMKNISLPVPRGGFKGGRAGRAPPPKIRKAYVIQR